MLSEIPTDQVPLLIGAVLIFLFGIFVIMKVTKALIKLLVAVGVLVVLAILFSDKLPL